MATYHTPSRRNYSNRSPRIPSPEEVHTSMNDIQLAYTRALEEIETLQREKSNLKSALSRAVDEHVDQDYRSYNRSLDNVSRELQQSYTQKALMDAEQRAMDLEDENLKLRRVLENNSVRVAKLQEEVFGYQERVDKFEHLELQNKHLLAEMQFLDQEFLTITKRVNELDEQKVKTQTNKAVSVKYSQDYNTTLIKYISNIAQTVEALDVKDPARVRYEELFPNGSSMLKLVNNRDYTNLTLKSIKFIMDLLPNAQHSQPSQPGQGGNVTDEDSQAHSTGDISPDPVAPHHRATKSTAREPLSSALLTSQTPKLAAPGSAAGSKSSKYSVQANLSASLPNNVSHDSKARSHRQDKLSASVKSPPQSSQLHSSLSQSSRSKARSNQEGVQRLDVVPNEHPMSSRSTKESGRDQIREVDYYEKRTAAELELMQRDRELVDRERDLIEKKMELLERAQELQRREEMFQDQKVRADLSRQNSQGSPYQVQIPPQQYVQQQQQYQPQPKTSERGKVATKAVPKPQIRSGGQTPNGSASAKSKANFNPELESGLLRSAGGSAGPSGSQLKPILKSQGSLGMLDIPPQKMQQVQSGGSSASQMKSAKEVSATLREKSKHLAQMLRKEKAVAQDYDSNDIKGGRRDIPSAKGSIKNLEKYSQPGSGVYQNNYVDPYQAGPEEDYHNVQGEEEEEEYDYDDEPRSEMRYEDLDNKRGSNYVGSNGNSLTHLAGSKRPPSFGRDDLSSVSKKVVSFESPLNANNVEYQEQFSSYKQQELDDYDEEEMAIHERLGRTGRNRSAEKPHGRQYASFTVSFGRTESLEKRIGSPEKEPGYILDSTKKGRVDHWYQTYDVVKGDDVVKKAVKDPGHLQYKMEDYKRGRNAYERLGSRQSDVGTPRKESEDVGVSASPKSQIVV